MIVISRIVETLYGRYICILVSSIVVTLSSSIATMETEFALH